MRRAWTGAALLAVCAAAILPAASPPPDRIPSPAPAPSPRAVCR